MLGGCSLSQVGLSATLVGFEFTKWTLCCGMPSLAEDLKHTHDFLENQRKLLGPAAFKAVLNAQATQWSSRLKSSKISMSDSVQVSSALAAGPWDAAQKELLGNALGDSVCSTSTPQRCRRPMQEIKSFPAYLTKRDLSVLKSPDQHDMIKVSIAVDRCVALGLHLPNTAALKHITASLVEGGWG